MNKTSISWCDYTLNPLTKLIPGLINGREVVAHGCNRISRACKYCYAESMNMQQRFLGDGKAYKYTTYTDMTLNLKTLNKLQTNIKKQKSVFICSMTDWAAIDEFVRLEWATKIIEACRRSKYTCYLLTKRAECLPEILRVWQCRHMVGEWPKNIWLGFTAEDQANFNNRWQYFTDEADGVLGRFPDCNIFISHEAALGPLVLPNDFFTTSCHDCKDGFKKGRFLIAGGESGQYARLSDPRWFLDIKDQCLENGVMFHFKQWGTWRPMYQPYYYLGYGVESGDMAKAPNAPGNDLLFGTAYKDTPTGGD